MLCLDEVLTQFLMREPKWYFHTVIIPGCLNFVLETGV